MIPFRLFSASDGITRKEAARIVHNYIKNTTKEADLTDIREAAYLLDLYACRVCVNSIAQMYLKGIIFPKEERVFGGDTVLSEEELVGIEERVFVPEKRVRPVISGTARISQTLQESQTAQISQIFQESQTARISRMLQESQTLQIQKSPPHFLSAEEFFGLHNPTLIDVRREEFFLENPTPGAKNIPLQQVVLNPHLCGEDLFANLVFCCKEGANAALAADQAAKAGYRNVHVMKLENLREEASK